MPIQFQDECVYRDRPARVITTITVRSRLELDKEFEKLGISPSVEFASIGELLLRGDTHYTVTNRFANKIYEVALQEIIREFEGANLDDLFIVYENRVIPDPTLPPEYPSDMVDEFRIMGVAEERIQALLELEQKLRESK